MPGAGEVFMGVVLQLRTKASRPMPAWTWDELEEELTRLAASPQQRAMVAALVSALAGATEYRPARQVLREVLCLATVIADEAYRPGSSDEPIETV
jgi:hypothetical protein